MIEVKEVSGKRMQKEFLNFPLKLYRDNPYFAPPLYGDEAKIFRRDFVYNDTCESVFFNAYKDGVMAGRISGIIQRVSNEKYGEKRVRFTRFDVIDDPEVSRALFDTLEKWALRKGMDTLVGPLSYSDLEREGLLIAGFDQMSTFEEQYNAEYYMHHLDALGFEKEVDWLESKIRLPKEKDPNVQKMADFVMKRYHLHIGESKNANDFLKKYADGFFDLLDRSYEHIYGTVPFTPGMKKMMIDNFRLIIDIKYVQAILDENNRVVALGCCFPALGEALQKSGGHLTPAALVRVLKALKHPTVVDFGLIGVDPIYLNRGVTAVLLAGIYKMMEDGQIEHAETNLNLEDNVSIRNLWKRFDAEEHKRRRCYVKKLEERA